LPALTGQKVITEMFGSESAGAKCGERDRAYRGRAADRPAVVAPATANVIAKIGASVADDFLTTLYLATTAPVVVAPRDERQYVGHAATPGKILTRCALAASTLFLPRKVIWPAA